MISSCATLAALGDRTRWRVEVGVARAAARFCLRAVRSTQKYAFCTAFFLIKMLIYVTAAH